MDGQHEEEADPERRDAPDRVDAEARDDRDLLNRCHVVVPLPGCRYRADPVLDDEADANRRDEGSDGSPAFESSENQKFEEDPNGSEHDERRDRP